MSNIELHTYDEYELLPNEEVFIDEPTIPRPTIYNTYDTLIDGKPTNSKHLYI